MKMSAEVLDNKRKLEDSDDEALAAPSEFYVEFVSNNCFEKFFIFILGIKKVVQSRLCPYLDTINRTVLDFDFEKLCSVSLTRINVYACLVCGKYFQGENFSFKTDFLCLI